MIMLVSPKYAKYATSLVFVLCSILGFSQEYELENSSSITVSGTSTLHDWTVEVKNQTGKMTVTAKKATDDKIKTGQLSHISVNLFVNDIQGSKGKTMNNKMYRALKKDLFPTITFTSNNPVEFDLIDRNGSVLKNLSGVLSVAGVEKKISTQVKAIYNNKKISLSGELPMKLSDFSIEPPTAMFGQIKTGNDISVNFDLEFVHN
ncbi:YceI family protein [Flagellimonas marina]|uniref:YceI family protein n=1 Tax=Flagellimonas marina TaxID=1775168 RepID=A0ABV8PMT9_9FLAO